jgi:hypothetical protein
LKQARGQQLGASAHAFPNAHASAAASSAEAGLEFTDSAFKAGDLRELGVALVRGNKIVYGEGLYAAGGTAAMAGAVIPTVKFED